MSIAEQQRRSYLTRQLGTLALSRVSAPNPMGLVRAVSWHNHLHRLGLSLPLFLVHDLGLLLTAGKQYGVRIGEHPLPISVSAELEATIAQYETLLGQLEQSELAQTATSWQIRDEIVSVLLYKLLWDLCLRWSGRRSWIEADELPLDPCLFLKVDPSLHFRDREMSPVRSLLEHLVQGRLHLLTSIEQIDLDTLRLLGLFQSSEKLGGAVDLADLLNIFSMPEVNDVVNFSMELLPSVLETKRQGGVQIFSVDGYASLERRGSIDSVILSELAIEQDIFEQKMLDNELFYYGHEKQRTEERRLHYILVDSSASMRGVRQVFARGLALTLIKKLSLQGNEVWLRFFDSRLYDILPVAENVEASIPYLLCFRSERGRNYGRVFRQLLGELERQQRQHQRTTVLYIITHGQCHLERELVERLRQIVYLYGVFILPSQTLHLDYLPLLQRHQIVEAEALVSRDRSVNRAKEIVDDATADPRGGS